MYTSQKYTNRRNFEENVTLKLLNRKFRYFYTRIKFPLVRRNKWNLRYFHVSQNRAVQHLVKVIS